MIYIINDIYSVLSNKNLFYIRYYIILFYHYSYYIFYTFYFIFNTIWLTIIDQNNIRNVDFCKKSRHQFIIESILVRLTYFQM